MTPVIKRPRSASRRALVLGLGALAGAAVAPSPASAIQAYQWKKRAVIVFSPSSSDARLARMRTMVSGNRTALLDREVVVVYVVGGDLSHDLGPPPGMSAGAIRSYYRASEGAFRVLLIGKDGGIKLDSPTPFNASDLTAEIDRMPMRRDEMKARSTNRP